MVSSLPADDVAYGLVRRSFIFEQAGGVKAETIKFVFISWFPPTVPLQRKMKVGPVDGAVKKAFHPFHDQIDASDKSELTEAILTTLLENLMGKRDNTGVEVVAKVEKKFFRSFVGGMDGKTQSMEFVDEAAVMSAISSVRDDSCETEWIIVSFNMSEKKPRLELKCVGVGFDAFKASLDEAAFNYGILRTSEVIDATTAIKFAYVRSHPEGTPFRMKGKLGLLAGAVAGVFSPYHGDAFIDDVGDLTQDNIADAVRKR